MIAAPVIEVVLLEKNLITDFYSHLRFFSMVITKIIIVANPKNISQTIAGLLA